MIEQSAVLLPTISTSRGKTILRYNRQVIERETETGGTETIYQNHCALLDAKDYPSNASSDTIKTWIAGALNRDVGEYIYGYYDAGTQQTMQALLSVGGVPVEIQTQIKSIFPWIQSALAYYYVKKDEVLASASPDTVTWDFSQFNSTKPDVTLSGIMSAIGAGE